MAEKVLIFHGFKCCLNMYKLVEMEAAVSAVMGSLCHTLARLCILRWSWYLQKGTSPSPPPELNLVFINSCLIQEVLGLNICKSDSALSIQSTVYSDFPPWEGLVWMLDSWSLLVLLFLAWWYFWKLNISSSIMLLETYSHLVHSSGSEMAIKENGSFETLMLWNKWCARTEI